MMRDLFSSLEAKRALAPVAAVTNDTAFVSAIFDTKNRGGALFVGVTGSLADANVTFTVLVEDGDDSSLTDNAAVADEFLHGVEAMGLQYDDDNSAFKIGYCGPKRYVRVTITPANNTGDIYLAGIWLGGLPRKKPKSTQIV